MECQPSFKTNYPYNVYFVKTPVVVNVHDCSKGKGKAVYIYKPLLFQGLPHRYFLTSYYPVSRGEVYTKVTVLA